MGKVGQCMCTKSYYIYQECDNSLFMVNACKLDHFISGHCAGEQMNMFEHSKNSYSILNFIEGFINKTVKLSDTIKKQITKF